LASGEDKEQVFRQLAQLIGRLSGRVRVAVDGRTASGKTTFADTLAAEIGKTGREVARTSIDGFHRPKAARYARGRYSAEGYYFDARDLDAVRTLLLDPLGPDGDGRYRTASFDLEHDQPIEQVAIRAATDAILIVDGTFLQRPELSDGWDVAVFVDTSEERAEARGIARDAERLGGLEAAKKLYADRYRPAFDLYEVLCHPRTNADVIIDNNDFQHPAMTVRPRGRLARGAQA
jgi:uridine kinase